MPREIYPGSPISRVPVDSDQPAEFPHGDYVLVTRSDASKILCLVPSFAHRTRRDGSSLGSSVARASRGEPRSLLMCLALRRVAVGRRSDSRGDPSPDQGRQHASERYQHLYRDLGDIQTSMGTAGNRYDHAMAESWFATLKLEDLPQDQYGYPSTTVIACGQLHQGMLQHPKVAFRLGTCQSQCL